jgi:hypothetical protein
VNDRPFIIFVLQKCHGDRILELHGCRKRGRALASDRHGNPVTPKSQPSPGFPAGAFSLLAPQLAAVATLGWPSGRPDLRQRPRSTRGQGDDNGQIGRQPQQTIILTVCPTVVDREVLALDTAGLT